MLLRSRPAAAAPTDTDSTEAATARPTNALYIVVLNRLRHDPRSRAYAQRRTQEGLTKPEIIRCLKRYVAREIYNILITLNLSGKPVRPALDNA